MTKLIYYEKIMSLFDQLYSDEKLNLNTKSYLYMSFVSTSEYFTHCYGLTRATFSSNNAATPPSSNIF